MHTKVPSLTSTIEKNIDHTIRDRDNTAKAKMKRDSDARRHAKPCPLIPGDTVLHKQQKHNKLITPYNSEPHTVSKVTGSMVTATRDGHSITRNSSFFKRVNPEVQDIPSDPDEEDDGDNSHVYTDTSDPHRFLCGIEKDFLELCIDLSMFLVSLYAYLS